MSEASPLHTRFPRQPRRGVMLGLSRARVTALMAALGLLVVCVLSRQKAALIFAGMVDFFVIAATFVQVQGRYAVEWAPLATEWQLRRFGKQRTFRAQLSQRRPAGTLALPGNAANLRLVNEHEVTYIHDPSAGTLTAALRLEHAAMVLLDQEAQRERVTEWSRVLSSLAGSESVDHVAIIEETIPDTGNGPEEWFLEHWTTKDDWASQQYWDFLRNNRAQSSIHRTTFTVTVNVGRRGLDDAVTNLASLRDNLERSLRMAGLRIKGWLNEADLAQQIRGAYSPFSSPTSSTLALAGPVAVDESWDRKRHDDGYSCVLVIAEFPAVPVGPQFLHSLIFSDCARHVFTLLARVNGIDDALRQVRRDLNSIESGADLKKKLGQAKEQSDDVERAATETREAALLQGHAEVTLTALVTVSARSVEDLERAVAQVKRDAGQCACEARPLWGMQSAAFVAAALPVGRVI